jgi:hypothetical protein
MWMEKTKSSEEGKKEQRIGLTEERFSKPVAGSK